MERGGPNWTAPFICAFAPLRLVADPLGSRAHRSRFGLWHRSLRRGHELPARHRHCPCTDGVHRRGLAVSEARRCRWSTWDDRRQLERLRRIGAKRPFQRRQCGSRQVHLDRTYGGSHSVFSSGGGPRQRLDNVQPRKGEGDRRERTLQLHRCDERGSAENGHQRSRRYRSEQTTIHSVQCNAAAVRLFLCRTGEGAETDRLPTPSAYILGGSFPAVVSGSRESPSVGTGTGLPPMSMRDIASRCGSSTASSAS
jgi:hypothetical protein